jgi:hypothetical protein
MECNINVTGLLFQPAIGDRAVATESWLLEVLPEHDCSSGEQFLSEQCFFNVSLGQLHISGTGLSERYVRLNLQPHMDLRVWRCKQLPVLKHCMI